MQSFLLLAGVSTASVIAIASLLWNAASRLGLLRRDVFDAADVRTWTLGFTLFEALFFGLIFSVIVHTLGGGATATAVGGGAAALMSLGLGQLFRRSRI